ncbi:hypothetical protein QE152_g9029 [Popillia japonica]|uniref:Uncharacterized protein n=1 Tax=Popillia japonica TaxID=7064 RepID=A0AAW1M001_POPJA
MSGRLPANAPATRTPVQGEPTHYLSHTHTHKSIKRKERTKVGSANASSFNTSCVFFGFRRNIVVYTNAVGYAAVRTGKNVDAVQD